MRYASFFTGAMGMDLGFEQAGFTCVFANEIDKVACRTVRANRPDLNLFEGDVRSLTSEIVLAAIDPRSVDVVIGGPPCQAFSTAGRRLGLNDERGNVFLHFLDLAIGLRPTVIVIENVRGLLSAPLVHRPHSERGFGFPPLSPTELRGGALAHILQKLKASGFDVSFELYDTANFGVPQRRERFVLFASRIGRVPALHPTHGQFEIGNHRWVTFADAVAEMPPHHEASKLRDKQKRYVQYLHPGQNWRNLPESLQREALGKSYECSGGRTGFLRRVAWDKPSPTLVTSPTMPATLLAHPVEDRPLSVQEYARLQTFPDHWVFEGTLAQRYRQIGNAVPVAFGKAVALHLLRFMNGEVSTYFGKPKAAPSRYSKTSDSEWLSKTPTEQC